MLDDTELTFGGTSHLLKERNRMVLHFFQFFNFHRIDGSKRIFYLINLRKVMTVAQKVTYEFDKNMSH